MPENDTQYDVLIIGAGVIGLSIAWRLAERGVRVAVVDRGEPGRGASWAGAGMVPAGPDLDRFNAASTIERLAGLSDRLHEQWSRELLEQTGVDNGYRRCGALYLAEETSDSDLERLQSRWTALGIEHSRLASEEIRSLEPAVGANGATRLLGVQVPNDAQIRNPRHVRALLAACERAGAEVHAYCDVHEIKFEEGSAVSVLVNAETLTADQICITAGCWSTDLLCALGMSTHVRPVRGQIALLAGPPGLLRGNVNVGPRYLVPRDDGRVLIGSTEEAAGFEALTTAEGVGGLLKFATRVAPPLGRLRLERCWAGLRPASEDGLPLIGRLPGYENAWTATGHFRAGLQLSPATAEVTAQLICGEPPDVDVAELSPSRLHNAAAT